MLIVYVGPFAYPSSSANSLRVKGVAKALMLAGHEVMICPGLMTPETIGDDECMPSESINYLNEYTSGLFSKLPSGIRGLFLGDVTVNWLKSMPRKPDAVILYGTHFGYLSRLLLYCRRFSVRLIVDVVEWYDPRHQPGGVLGPFALANELSMRWLVLQADSLLVISSYLENYYRAKGCITRRVPPLFSEFPDRPAQLCTQNGLLNLCYSGTPGKKEEFQLLLEGVRLALAAGVRLKLHIIGISTSEFLSRFPNAAILLAEHDGVLALHGPLSNKEARSLVAASDFSLIARRPLRFANAGFPFKVAESMTLGTPVITNSFSDINQYLTDGINAVFIEKLEAGAVCRSLIRVASQDGKTRLAMQDNARATAREMFSVFVQRDMFK